MGVVCASVCGYALSIPGLAFKSPAETHTLSLATHCYSARDACDARVLVSKNGPRTELELVKRKLSSHTAPVLLLACTCFGASPRSWHENLLSARLAPRLLSDGISVLFFRGS